MDQSSTQPSSQWINSLQKSIDLDHGSLTGLDKLGTPITFTWVRTDAQATNFKSVMSSICNLTVAAFTQVEMDFLRANPNVVGNDPTFKLFEPLFSSGIEQVNWQAATELMQARLQQMTDPANWNDQVLKHFGQDFFFIVTIKNSSNAIIGFATFHVASTYKQSDIRVTGIATVPEEQNKGLGKLLMSSIFAIYPEAQRLFLSTRITNTTALRAYQAWGFTLDINTPVPDYMNKEHWTHLEYKATEQQVLQKVAATLKK